MNDTPINPTPLDSTEPTPAPAPEPTPIAEPTSMTEPAPVAEPVTEPAPIAEPVSTEAPATEPAPATEAPAAEPASATETPATEPAPAPVISSAPAPAATPAEEPKKKSSTLKIILIVVGILALITLLPVIFAVVTFIFAATADDPTLGTKEDFYKELETYNLVTAKDDEHPIKCMSFKTKSGETITIYGAKSSDCVHAGSVVSNSAF